MINIEEFTDFTTKHKLSEKQFILLYFLYMIKFVDKERFMPMMIRYIKVHGVKENGKLKFAPDTTKKDLIERGFMKKGQGTGVAAYELTSKFLDAFVSEHIAGRDFVNAYPARAVIKGTYIPLKTSDKDEMRRLYVDRIRHSRAEHEEVMQDLEFAVNAGIVNMSIEKFIRSEQWEDIREQRLEGSDDAGNTNYVVVDDDL